jgi:hydrogenase nickel incorporation protein HypA/HybF
MHELSICRAIAATVTGHAGGRRVVRVRLRVGHLRQVVPETLAACWELHTRGTGLEASVLDVDYIAAIAHCAACDLDTTLDQPIVRCGRCGSADVELLSGEEFLIESIDVGEEMT